MRNAAGELDHLDAALDVALGVGQHLAVLGGEKRREALVLLGDQLQKLEHHARAPLRIGRCPCRESSLRVRDRLFDFRLAGKRALGLYLAKVALASKAEVEK